jgi:hypothetical protein
LTRFRLHTLGNGNKERDEVKYFTPNLLAKFRSDDPAVAEAAAAKWQLHTESYHKRLKEIQYSLPSSVRQFMRSVTLHDAYLVNIARASHRPQLFLSLQLPDTHGQAGVQLRYVLVKPFKVRFHEANASPDAELFALYDEFDALQNGTLTHSILMTAGVEIIVPFSHLSIVQFTKVVAPTRGRSDFREQLAAMATS